MPTYVHRSTHAGRLKVKVARSRQQYIMNFHGPKPLRMTGNTCAHEHRTDDTHLSRTARPSLGCLITCCSSFCQTRHVNDGSTFASTCSPLWSTTITMTMVISPTRNTIRKEDAKKKTRSIRLIGRLIDSGSVRRRAGLVLF